jgi:hypothetical protein
LSRAAGHCRAAVRRCPAVVPQLPPSLHYTGLGSRCLRLQAMAEALLRLCCLPRSKAVKQWIATHDVKKAVVVGAGFIGERSAGWQAGGGRLAR